LIFLPHPSPIHSWTLYMTYLVHTYPSQVYTDLCLFFCVCLIHLSPFTFLFNTFHPSLTHIHLCLRALGTISKSQFADAVWIMSNAVFPLKHLQPILLIVSCFSVNWSKKLKCNLCYLINIV
jgi:hypothetical protein